MTTLLTTILPIVIYPSQMQTVLTYVARRAYFDLPPEAAQEIIKDSGGNLRKAILVLEALKMQSYVRSRQSSGAPVLRYFGVDR